MNTPSMETLALRRENEALRAEVASLKEENAALKKNRRDKFYEAIDGRAEIESLTQQLADSEATVKALRAALIWARDRGENWGDVVRDALTALPQQVQSEDARDAERYRWLRRRDLDTIDHGGLFVGKTPENIVINDMDLDSAIDAAISVQEPRG